MGIQNLRASADSRQAVRSVHRTRPVDGIIIGMDETDGGGPIVKAWVSNTWILAASPTEPLADFFLEDAEEPSSLVEPSGAWLCRSVRADGTLEIRSVNLQDDRFLSEIFSPEADD